MTTSTSLAADRSTVGTPAAAPASAATAALVFGRRSLQRIRHAPEQLADAVLFPIIFTLLFAYLFGGAIAGDSTAYVQYLVPGILVQSVLMLTMNTGAALRADIDRGILDRFRAMPIWRPAPLVGMLLGDAVRYLLAATVVSTLGLAIGWRPTGGVGGLVLAVLVVLAFAFALGWVWIAIGLFARNATTVTSISWLVIVPLTFASNLFVDPSTMPAWLESVVAFNPVSHVVTATRDLAGGEAAVASTGVALAWSVAITAAGGMLAMGGYRRIQ